MQPVNLLFYRKLLYYRKYILSFWLGATDEKEEGTWEWVTGEEFSYNNWFFGEPHYGDRYGVGPVNWLCTSPGVLIQNGKSSYGYNWKAATEYGPVGASGKVEYKPCFICEWE